MRVYRDLSVDFVRNTVATIGIFDGVHIAHKQIIDRLTHLAKEHETESMLITLWPHPRYVLNKDPNKLKLITTLDEKVCQLEKAGLDNLLIVPFDKKFAGLSFENFIKLILVEKLHVKHMVIGYNHQFGKDRQGNFENLLKQSEKYGFGLEELKKIEVSENRVSSSAIRNAINLGEFELANRMLGYTFQLNGVVVHGNKLGRKIGFPTANIEIPEIYKIVPLKGVYAVKAKIDDTMVNGMLNIGKRPTIDSKGLRVIEANFFNFSQDIYNKHITIFFYKRIRDEIKFPSAEHLIQQLEKDKISIQEFFDNKTKNMHHEK